MLWEVPNNVEALTKRYVRQNMPSDATVVKISDSVRYVENNAFAGRANLVKVTMGHNVEIIATAAFEGCAKLTTVILHEGLSEIHSSAFHGCTMLATVDLPRSLRRIDSGAFVESGVKSVVVPDYIYRIESGTFRDCPNLTDLVLGQNVDHIGMSAMRCCDSLTRVVLPESLRSIDDNVLAECPNLTDLVLGQNVRHIGKYAISYCDRLTRIVLPESLRSIDEYALATCPNLRSVVVNGPLDEVHESAFAGSPVRFTVGGIEWPLTIYSAQEATAIHQWWHDNVDDATFMSHFRAASVYNVMGIIRAAHQEGKRDDAQTEVLLRAVMGSRFIDALVHDHNADVGTMLKQAGMAVRSGHSRGGLYTELRLVDWKSLQLASKSMAMHPSALWASSGHSEPQNVDANNNAAQSSGSENNDDSTGHASDAASKRRRP